MTDRWGWRVLFALGGLLLVIVGFGLCLNIFGGKILQRAVSPDGRTVADIRINEFAAATDVARSTVELRRWPDPIRSTVFFYVNNGAKVRISWTDSHNLLVDCDDTCDHLDVDGLHRHWKDITIHYSPDLIRGTRWEKSGD